MPIHCNMLLVLFHYQSEESLVGLGVSCESLLTLSDFVQRKSLPLFKDYYDFYDYNVRSQLIVKLTIVPVVVYLFIK